MATTIDTLANVKVRLGISGSSDDTLIAALMESADKAFTRHVGGRTWPAAATSITEYHDAGENPLQVRRPPIDSVTSIKVDPDYGFGAGITALVADDEYRVRSATAGIVQCLYGATWLTQAVGTIRTLDGLPRYTDLPGVVRIIYVGDGPASEDVQEAFALQVLHFYTVAKTEADAAYKRLAFTSDGTTQRQRFAGQAENFATAAMPAIVQAILAPYRIRPL